MAAPTTAPNGIAVTAPAPKLSAAKSRGALKRLKAKQAGKKDKTAASASETETESEAEVSRTVFVAVLATDQWDSP